MENDTPHVPAAEDDTDPQTRPPREPGPVQPDEHEFTDWALI